MKQLFIEYLRRERHIRPALDPREGGLFMLRHHGAAHPVEIGTVSGMPLVFSWVL
jgi:hypothetical protein